MFTVIIITITILILCNCVNVLPFVEQEGCTSIYVSRGLSRLGILTLIINMMEIIIIMVTVIIDLISIVMTIIIILGILETSI